MESRKLRSNHTFKQEDKIMQIKDKKFYGSTTVGEKGQVVLPVKLRRDLKINAGEKLSVIVLKHKGMEGIIMVKSKVLTFVIEKFFGGSAKKLTK